MNSSPVHQHLADSRAMKLTSHDMVLAPANLEVFRCEVENSTRISSVSGPCRSRAQAASRLGQQKHPAPAIRWRRRIAPLQTHLEPAIPQESAP